MAFLFIMPHLYALILCLVLEPYQERALRSKLSSITEVAEHHIEEVVFINTMKEFTNAPLIALIPTAVTALEKGNPVLTGLVVFIFVLLVVVFQLINSIWKPYDLNRLQRIFRFEISGRNILRIAKAATVTLTAIFVVLARV